jgi:hypothetical protein
MLVGGSIVSLRPAMRRFQCVAAPALALVLLVGSGPGSNSGSADGGTGSGAAVAPGALRARPTVVLGILLPWLAVAGLVAAGVLASVRVVRRRMAVVAPAPPAPPQG